MVRGALGREVSRVYIALRRKEVHRVEILMRVAGVLAEEFVEGALWRTVRRAGRLIRWGYIIPTRCRGDVLEL